MYIQTLTRIFSHNVREILKASLVAQRVKNLPEMQEAWVWSLGEEDPLEEGMATTPVFLLGAFH